jgi:hypothetical protein|tara:strand:+ start:299 stop:772 length:474 start_codon:yes stop_codon:yes gene_type:complete
MGSAPKIPSSKSEDTKFHSFIDQASAVSAKWNRKDKEHKEKQKDMKKQNLDEDIVPIVIDLSAARNGQVNESFLRQFGDSIKLLMKAMFGTGRVSASIRGSQREIEAFKNTLANERNYIRAYQRYGLDDPRTFRNKGKLKSTISKFERETGIKWPFK